MLEGYSVLSFVAAQDRADAARPARHRRHLPAPGPARQDRHHARRRCPAAGRCSASARPGTSASTARSACPTRRSRSGSSGSRRPSRSASRCGATTTARTRASTTSSPRRSAVRARCSRRARRSSSAAAARRRPCAWSRSTPTRATCSARRPPDVRHKLDVLRGHCDAEGRDYDAIEKTIIGRGGPDRRPGRVPSRDGGVRQARHRHGRRPEYLTRPGRDGQKAQGCGPAPRPDRTLVIA